MTSVSSQSDKLSGTTWLPDSAWMISARFEMLFEAGNWAVCFSTFGAVIVYCMDNVISEYLFI